MEVDVIAPRAPHVPQSPSSALMGEVEEPIDSRKPKDKKRGAPVKDLVYVSIYNKKPTKMVKVGSNLSD